jgi:hypothetical protein
MATLGDFRPITARAKHYPESLPSLQGSMKANLELIRNE